jgi:hypothetical protein
VIVRTSCYVRVYIHLSKQKLVHKGFHLGISEMLNKSTSRLAIGLILTLLDSAWHW